MAVEGTDGLLARLLAEYLDAADQGRDVADELLARAGPVRAELEERIRFERAMGELSGDLAPYPDRAPLFGRFQVLGTLGRGGISHVLLAYDPKLGRRIALKTLDHDVLLDKGQRAWILNEGRSLARIDHPGVVKVHDVGESGKYTWIAMELLAGPSLHEVIQEWRRERGEKVAGDPPLGAAMLADRLRPYSARAEDLARLAEALAYCHDRGVLHRDVKPRNVLFDDRGNPKWIDFGLAHVEGTDEDSRLGLTQNLVGTAAYLAPEQVSREETGADPRSDQFAFATLAYETLALENPFHRRTQRAIKVAVEEADPPPLRTKEPAVPPDLARVIGHAHAADALDRYPGMDALAADLRAVLEHRPVSVAESSLAHVARLWLRRHRRGVAIASVVLLSACKTFTPDGGMSTVAAVAGVIWAGRALGRRPAVVRALGSGAVATLLTAPITAYAFGTVAPVGVVANLLAIPLGAVAVPGLFVAVLLSWVTPALAALFAAGSGVVLALLDAVAGVAAGVPGGHIVTAAGWGSAALWTAVAAAAWYVWNGRGSRWWVGGRLMLVAGVVSWSLVVRVLSLDSSPGLTVHFLDVGQGDATVVEDDPKDENYEILEENLARLRTFRDEAGRPFRIVPIPMPGIIQYEEQRLPASYANFYIANRVILLPIFHDTNDRWAKAVLEKAFPDRTVVGIDCRELIWGLGAFHCLTQQQPKE